MLKISKDIYRNKAIPLLYAFGIFGFPLVSSIPVLMDMESRPISLAMRITVLLLSLLLLLPIKKFVLSNRYFLLFIIFWLLYILQILYTLVTEDQIVGFLSNLEFFALAFGTCLIPSLAIFMGLQNKKWNADSIFKVTYYVLLIATMGSIYLSFKQSGHVDLNASRLSTTVLNPITLGHTGASLAILSLNSFISGRQVKRSTYLLNILGVLIGVLAILSSASKGPVVSFLVVISINILYVVKPKKAINIFIISVVGFFFTSFALGFLKKKFNLSALERLIALKDVAEGKEGDMSTSSRIEMYVNSWDQFLSSPLWGSSIIEKNSGYYPHNVILESFMSTGLLGGLIFIVLSLFLIQKSIFLLKNYAVGWSGLLAIQYYIASLFSGSLFGSSNMWLSMVFVFSACAFYSNQRRPLI